MGNKHTSHRENVTSNKGSNNNNLNEVSGDKRGGSLQTGGSRQPRQKNCDPSGMNNANGSIDLFFELPARVISKLFRPKRPLCGQPLTLNVSGTTFCCRAELFDNLHSTPSTVGGDENEHPLVLFSVIVALAPLVSNHPTRHYQNNTDNKNTGVDSTFRTIERIHRNLARLCQVLIREERRCKYVTLQCQKMLAVRKQYDESLLPKSGGKSGGDTNQSINLARNSDESNSNGTNKRRVSNTPGSNHAQTPSTANKGESKAAPAMYSSDNDGDKNSPSDRREYVQQLIEIMFASSPPDSNHGNLAIELAQVFHFLSQRDDPASPTTITAILSKASGPNVYINKHVAVPLDSMLESSCMNITKTISAPNATMVHPYQTLLFPTLSPIEVLHALSSDENINLSYAVGSSNSATDNSSSVPMSHAIRRVLTQLHPRKSLKEVSVDSALPIQQGEFLFFLLTCTYSSFSLGYSSSLVAGLAVVLEAAKWLVVSEICVAALPVTRKSRFICVEGVVDVMKKLSMPFWQTFNSKAQHCQFHFNIGAEDTVISGVPHIFLVVGALTSNAVAPMTNERQSPASSPELGDVIDSLCRGENSINRRDVNSSTNLYRTLGSTGSVQREEPSTTEGIVYSMTVWLTANGVIAHATGNR
eukprot:scaffold10383_cov44-Cyclotella_meneghiniana.AAC.5